MDKLQNFFLAMDKKQKIALAGALVLVLAILIFLANPAKRFMERRNSQRRSDAFNLLTAIYDYANENKDIVDKIGVEPKEICALKSDCGDLLDISDLVMKKFIDAIPSDPKKHTQKGTGYMISKNANGRMTVLAPGAEGGVKITATR